MVLFGHARRHKMGTSLKGIILVGLLAVCMTGLTNKSTMGAELIAHWPLDQDSGEDVKDVIGNHHGTLIGGKAVWVPARFGKGLQIEAPNQYVEVKKSEDLELETVTLVAWVNLSILGSRQEIVSYADSYGIFAEGGIFKALLFNGAGWNVVNGVTPIEQDKWYQTALTVSKNEIKIYVNGRLDAKLATPKIAYQNFPLWFGGGPADNSFWLTGILDEIEIWNDTLTEDEIQKLFESPPSVGLVRPSGKVTTTWGSIKSM